MKAHDDRRDAVGGLGDPELSAVWDGLELPPPDPVPLGYVDRVVAHCRSAEAGPQPLTPWTRAAAFAALLLGAWLGQGLAVAEPATGVGPSAALRAPVAAEVTDPALGPMVPSLAEVYWSIEMDWLDEELETGEGEGRP